jgi:hypothetical protein
MYESNLQVIYILFIFIGKIFYCLSIFVHGYYILKWWSQTFVFIKLTKILILFMYFPSRPIHQTSETTKLYKALALHKTYATHCKVKLLPSSNILVKCNGNLKCFGVYLIFVINYHQTINYFNVIIFGSNIQFQFLLQHAAGLSIGLNFRFSSKCSSCDDFSINLFIRYS